MMKRKLAIFLGGAILLSWFPLSRAVQIPPSFRPWTESFDLSRCTVTKRLGMGWSIRQNLHYPEVCEAFVVDSAEFLFTVQAPSGAMLKLKAHSVSHYPKFLVKFNGVPLQNQMEASKRTNRWTWILQPDILNRGVNTIHITNLDSKNPLAVEKIELANVRRSYPGLGAILVPDVSTPPSKTSAMGQTAFGGVLTCLLSVCVVFCLTKRIHPPPSTYLWALAFPAITVLVLAAVALGNVLTPYVFLIKVNRLLQIWVGTWGLSLCYLLGWLSFRPLLEATPRLFRSMKKAARNILRIRWRLKNVVQRAENAIRRAQNVMRFSLKKFGIFVEKTLSSHHLKLLVLVSVFFVAFVCRSLFWIQNPSQPLSKIGTGHDSDVYFNTAIAISNIYPFPLGIIHSNALATLGGFWNSSLILSCFLGRYIRFFGFYPGLTYWVWTMIVLGSILCLVPYHWQKKFRYPGVGGVCTGMLLAISPILQQELPRVMTDHLGLFALAVVVLLLGRLAVRGRWRDLFFSSVGLAILVLSRSAMLLLAPAFLVSLGYVWWAAPPLNSDHGRTRWIKFFSLCHRIENPKVRGSIRSTPANPLPPKGVIRKICIHQRIPKPLCPLCPVDEKILY